MRDPSIDRDLDEDDALGLADDPYELLADYADGQADDWPDRKDAE